MKRKAGTRRAPGWALIAGLLVLASGSAPTLADAGDLRIAAWNLEHLNDEHGEGCIERTAEDYDAIARRIEALGADVVAFQEVENEAAARRVFDPAKWNVAMSSRPDTGQRRTCYDRVEGRLQHQATGIAIRRSVAYRRGTDLASLSGGDPHLRWGTHVVVGRGERELHVLSVHLKTGCWGAYQDEQGRESCTVLRSQMTALGKWIDERQRSGEMFAIAGDFNRRLAIPGDWAWQVLSPQSSPLELVTAGHPSHCDPRFPNFIDHIVLGGAAGPIARPGSFREEARDGPHPDHCPISVAIRDGPAGSTGTRAALKAWTSAFARTSTDHIVTSVERRLSRRPGSYAAPGFAALFGEGGSPGLENLLSAGAFQLSPASRAGNRQWTLWGAGTAASTSTDKHDLHGRVRTATLGADVERDAVTIGLTLSHSRGSGSTLPTGPIEAELSSIAPYAAIMPRKGLRLWGVLGKGRGRLRFEPAAGEPVRTGLKTTLGALGFRAELGEAHSLRWSTLASAALTGTETGNLADLAPVASHAGRLRAGIEGLRRFDLADDSVLTPSAELGLFHDIGDDASRDALEFGAGLHYTSADGLFSADGRAKGYLAGDGGEGWEIAGRLVVSPLSDERGLSLALVPTLGGGRRASLPGSEEAWSPLPSALGGGQLGADIAYGVALGGGRGMLIPYGGADWTGARDRAARFGVRWHWGEGLSGSFGGELGGRGNGSAAYAVFARFRLHR